jgi:mannose-1-phosphate guanylyltransferase
VSRWVVILAGGVGSRFWPLSTPAKPKQLLPLVDEQPLLGNTLARLAPLADAAHTLILTNASLVGPIHELFPAIPNENLIAEPRPAGTAAALAWAAAEIARREGQRAIMMSVHADWAVGDPEGFRQSLLRAAEIASAHGALVTVGVVPRRPDPGLGYIRPGEHVEGNARRVAQFVEKPDRARAEAMVREGCLWNSGIFVWRVGDFLEEVHKLTPEVGPALMHAAGDLGHFFANVRSVSVDVGVLERSQRVMVIPGDFGWDDIGTWSALRRARSLDEHGNALHGEVHAVGAQDNVAYAGSGRIVLYGVTDLVVVERDGLTLVTTTERAMDLKALLEALPPSVRERA